MRPMATSTRSRSQPIQKRASSKKSKVAPRNSWGKQIGDFFSGMIPSFEIADRLRREIFGISLVLVALMSSWALGRGDQDGAVIAWWAEVLRDSFGNAS